ncbi:MAG: imidazole glycerol phosphate synthase, glutamine amidotransferase subunit [Deltaproteobacteria bacterium RIFCSPLOWO2_01_44_7]|nr:MAG: imidazole glycerol phosphate synthase, glutamine amidotransferase subunit [Deltaproteobacteria bacterium RIFCSPHIGHO2_01_FULL_43_49]OGQ15069.1 MAG: imidazole glycerol phosphate synthase, glutamine amidotransferase subunit [Deltaproteobacteria bacterium RIFCSPHIGHO2_02_FULL_44_53]OGQ27311.1 MAG: imidazole glycerol phosphate synthase, glutamine amidotransferase subunit [Deltaproteobacteria bacterium RIFCSPHIGHO2_12_FULL_44_21]OGQ31586.1 MAG: imidazole glycerol phosphate synthase, glutamine
MIVVVDYGMGNVGSILNMIRKTGGSAIISGNLKDVEMAEKLVLPGVGAFDNGVKNLQDIGLWDILNHKVCKNKTPILGICLGMQLFTDGSEEGNLAGFGWVKAKTIRFRFKEDARQIKIPHMGWNQVFLKKSSPIFQEMHKEPRFYFVHSYHLICEEEQDVVSVTRYGHEFVSAIQKENIYATQFHPEKSHKYGLQLIRNFVEVC